MNLIQDLQERNLIQDIMPGTAEQLNKEMTSAYIGFDPTADSLHVGSLLPITLLMRLQRAGHKPIALVGGATGMIGDPSGKSAERNLLDVATIQKNCEGIKKQLSQFLNFDPSVPNAAELVNNYEWFESFSFLEFIRDIGKHISVNYMMSKDSVQKRLETGISFTEFTYQLIQGYDFYYLRKNKNVKLQMGGADQWGNIVTGTELIRRKEAGDAFAFTCKLITKSDGTKFGKSEGGNIWLDPAKTSPYQFYQFWLKLSDADVVNMAFVFSFKEVAALKELVAQQEAAPHLRILQKELAKEMTILVHGEAAYEFALKASEILFAPTTLETLQSLSEAQLLDVLEGVPQVQGVLAELEQGLDLITFMADQKIVNSKGDARKLIQNGGVAINKQKVGVEQTQINTSDLLN
ncbi:MAG: tyrosine--tRNA ligase, partial [Chitinophagia bacterium]|nr:tyrosine--tRNA ligase [Chitinophagia bacterium]